MNLFSADKGNVFPSEIVGNLSAGGMSRWEESSHMPGGGAFLVVHACFISVPEVMNEFEELGREETFFILGVSLQTFVSGNIFL